MPGTTCLAPIRSPSMRIVAAFTFGLVVLCAAFAGAISSLSMRGDQALQALHESSRGQSAGVARTRLRLVLLSLEVGLTVVLLVGAGLLLKSYAQLRSTDLGCLTDNVLKMDLSLPSASYKEPAQISSFFSSFLGRVRSIPGIQASGPDLSGCAGRCAGATTDFVIIEHPPLPRENVTSPITAGATPATLPRSGFRF
jgi:hypothetical protein